MARAFLQLCCPGLLIAQDALASAHPAANSSDRNLLPIPLKPSAAIAYLSLRLLADLTHIIRESLLSVLCIVEVIMLAVGSQAVIACAFHSSDLAVTEHLKSNSQLVKPCRAPCPFLPATAIPIDLLFQSSATIFRTLPSRCLSSTFFAHCY